MPTVILGIDPGSYSAGVALINEDAEVLWTRAWHSSVKDRTKRMYSLWKWLRICMWDAIFYRTGDVVVVACEDPWMRYAKTVKALSECKGLAMSCVFGECARYDADWDLRWMDIAPTEGKVALTGKGNSSKEQMMDAVRAQFGLEVSEDEADAVGIALAALAKIKEEMLVKEEEEDG